MVNRHDNAISLAVSADQWRLYRLRKADSAFVSIEQKVSKRDNYCCRFCDFQSMQHMTVINRDGNYLNNRLSNLVTACPLCEQCFFLESVGKGEFGGGVLIYLPEFSQNELNALCHLLFCSIATGNSFAKQAKNTLRDFKLRAQIVEKNIGLGLSNPALYGQVLIDASPERQVNEVHKNLQQKIRLLPSLHHFSKQVSAWVKEATHAMISKD